MISLYKLSGKLYSKNYKTEIPKEGSKRLQRCKYVITVQFVPYVYNVCGI